MYRYNLLHLFSRLLVCTLFQAENVILYNQLGVHTLEKWILSQHSWTAYSSFSRDWSLWDFLFPRWHVIVIWILFRHLYCCSIMGVAFLSFLASAVLKQTSWASGSYDLPTPLYKYSLSLRCRRCVVMCLLRLGILWSVVLYISTGRVCLWWPPTAVEKLWWRVRAMLSVGISISI